MRSVRLPTPRSELTDVKKRLYELERRIRGLSTTDRHKQVLVPLTPFNVNGTLSVAGTDELPVPTCEIALVRARLKTTGSSTTTALLKTSTATTLATFSFTSGNNSPTTTPTISTQLPDGAYLWLDVTAAGTGAAGLVVAVWVWVRV